MEMLGEAGRRRKSSAVLRAGSGLAVAATSAAACSGAFAVLSHPAAAAGQRAEASSSSHAGARQVSLRGVAVQSEPRGRCTAAGSFCGSSHDSTSAKEGLRLLLGPYVTSCVVLAAAKRRRRKVESAVPQTRPRKSSESAARIEDIVGEELDEIEYGIRKPKVDGREVTGAAADAAAAFDMTDEDVRKRRYAKKIALASKPEDLADEYLDELAIQYGDPDIFNIPFIWVQLGHVILFGTALLALVGGENLEEFAVFDLSPEFLGTLQKLIASCVSINFLLAAYTFYEEYTGSDEPERTLWGAGWAAKTVVIGGVATWQRNFQKIRQKEDEKERALEIELRKEGARKAMAKAKLKPKQAKS
eukprot:TRINITY_DN11494_c0_g1_i1.p1 TRINITY_DN11494_c0_g1~~TRINITY_DN11494_c0_g1_i1.p1  ORF type:complete len:360 (+),score=91.58 TRINITY_DN11494_c0_g1_i1:90-1169(+)